MLKHIVMLLLGSTSCIAATQQVSGQTNRSEANWSQTINIPQFNSSLGTLNAIKVTFRCVVDGTLRGENTSPTSDAILTSTLSANCLTSGFNLSLSPSTNFSFNAQPFDGVLDFGGTSGFTNSDLTDSAFGSTAFLSDSNTLNQFAGSGNVTFSISATGASVVTGPGNFVAGTTTFAQGFITVEYDYTPVAPAPSEVPTLSEWGMIALVGFLGLFGARQSLSRQN